MMTRHLFTPIQMRLVHVVSLGGGPWQEEWQKCQRIKTFHMLTCLQCLHADLDNWISLQEGRAEHWPCPQCGAQRADGQRSPPADRRLRRWMRANQQGRHCGPAQGEGDAGNWPKSQHMPEAIQETTIGPQGLQTAQKSMTLNCCVSNAVCKEGSRRCKLNEANLWMVNEIKTCIF